MNFAPRLFCLGAGRHKRRLGSRRTIRTLRNQSWSFAAASAFSMTVSVNGATLLANRFNGETQNDYRVANPAVLDLSTFLWTGLSRTFLRPTCSARSRRRKLSGRLRRIFARRRTS